MEVLFSPEVKNAIISNHLKGKTVMLYTNMGKEKFEYPDLIGQKAVVISCGSQVEVEIHGKKIMVKYSNLDAIIPAGKFDVENFKAWYQTREYYWVNKKDINKKDCPSKPEERIGDIYWKCKQIFSKVEMLHLEEVIFSNQYYSMDDVRAIKESVITILEGRK